MTERSLSELAGHDLHAQRRLVTLLDRYRREGLAGLRAAVEQEYLHEHGMPEARDFWATQLLVEAVLTIAEQRSRPMASRRAWEDFDADETRGEAARIEKGGNR